MIDDMGPFCGVCRSLLWCMNADFACAMCAAAEARAAEAATAAGAVAEAAETEVAAATSRGRKAR